MSTEELTAKQRKLIVEICLIRAYRERPSLYNKQVQQTVSQEDRERLWEEVAEAAGLLF